MRPILVSGFSPSVDFTALRIALTVLLVAASSVAPAMPPAEVTLGDAPVRHESQDTSGWSPMPKAAKSRDAVVVRFNTVYTPGISVPLLWTGSVAGCNPGTANIDHQQATIDRVNYYRALVDLPPVTLLTGTPTTQTQAAALMFSANNALSHSPPPSWLCYSADGASGAGSSNIFLGRIGPLAIDGYIDDFGASNTAAGHRRWILFPPRAAIATGDVAGGNTPPRPANALYVFGPQNTRPATPNGIAWPPAGYVPYQNLPVTSNRWSFSYPNADFSNATVTVVGPGGPVLVTKEPLATGYGDNTVVFVPAGVTYAKPSADTSYTVTLSGMSGPGVPPTIQYTVTIIDPAASSPPSTTATVVEYYWAMRDHYFITSAPAEIAALDAAPPGGWVRTGRTFMTYPTAQAGTSPVCRFYLPPQFGDSHFYGRSTAECDGTHAKYPGFTYESPAVMYLFLPVLGTCPSGTVPVYRVFDGRADANHRYMIERSVRDQMVAQGWIAEGDGPDFVVMCAPP